LDETYADRDDRAFSPSAGLAWRATETLTARAAAYSAYRTPTLNELYRPFRVGPVTTQANPELEPATLVGGELGLAYPSHDPTRALSLDLHARWFSNQYEDDLNTLTLASATRLDFAAHYAFTPRLRLTLAVENLLDEEIETGRTAAGVVNIAPPRQARAELTYA